MLLSTLKLFFCFNRIVFLHSAHPNSSLDGWEVTVRWTAAWFPLDGLRPTPPMQPPNLPAPLTEVLSPNSSQIISHHCLSSFSPPSLSPSLPSFLSLLHFLFCFHPTHDCKYTFLDQPSVTTHPFSFFLSKKKKKKVCGFKFVRKGRKKDGKRNTFSYTGI